MWSSKKPTARSGSRRGRLTADQSLYVLMRALAPEVIVESGVFRGLTTWVMRQACPQAEEADRPVRVEARQAHGRPVDGVVARARIAVAQTRDSGT
jgi:predicted O-methyltransferase YrrM